MQFLCLSHKKNSKGFTLVELLIVIAIIAILASTLIPNLLIAREKAQDTRIKIILKNAQAEAAVFFSEHNTFNGLCSPSVVSVPNLFYDHIMTALSYFPSVYDFFAQNGIGSGPFIYNDFYSPQPTSSPIQGAVCNVSSTGNAYALMITLKQPNIPNAGFCIDSSGKAMETTILGDVFVDLSDPNYYDTYNSTICGQ